MINSLVKNNIKNNLVYHSSPFKLDILSGQKTSTWSNEVGNVFVTPCKGIAACFLINKNQILDKLNQQFPGKIIGLNFGYDIWNKPIEELYTIPTNINILLNLPGIKQFSGISTGYLYTIDFTPFQNKCHMFNKNPNSDVQFLIEGDITPLKCQKITINWTVMSNQQEIKRHGVAKVIECYDPPYNQQQMRNANYSQKIITKLKNDPAHSWRMKTGIELIHQEPSLNEQKRIWKNWQLMTPEQKEVSQKKSLELFGKTNQQHHKEIINNYWKEPIFQSKFQKLFQLIMEEYDAEYLPISSNRCTYIKQSGHCIDRFLERFWDDISKQQLLIILQQLFLKLDQQIETKFNIYCDNSLIMLPIIINNKIGNILTIRKMQIWQKNRKQNNLHQDFKILHLNL